MRFVHFLRASGRFLGSYGLLALYLMLGVVAMATFWWFRTREFVQLQRSASTVRDWIVDQVRDRTSGQEWSAYAESILRFVLDERQILLMGFVLATRLALEIVLVLPIRAVRSLR